MKITQIGYVEDEEGGGVGVIEREYRLSGGSHKFNGNGMAEWLYDLSCEGMDQADEVTGNTDLGWMHRYGKRILIGDSQGNVWLTKYSCVEDAEEEFRLFDAQVNWTAVWDSLEGEVAEAVSEWAKVVDAPLKLISKLRESFSETIFNFQDQGWEF